MSHHSLATALPVLHVAIGMATRQLDVPTLGKKGKARPGKKKKDGATDKRVKGLKSQHVLSASMEVPGPLSSGVVLTQGEGYNPLAWDSMPAALQKQFPHWKSSSPATKRTHEEDNKELPPEEHPFLISSAKSQVQPEHGIPYVVMEGETLNSIALKFDTTPAELARFNKKTLAGFSLFPGNVVYVPDGEETTSPVDTLPLQRMAPCKSAPPFLEHSSPTPERDAPPTQSLPTNQINASKKNLEHTRSQELHPKISLDVTSRKRTVSTSAVLDNYDCLTKNDEKYVTLSSKFISDDQGCVHGTLTVSTSALIFKPNQSDPLVQEQGSDHYDLFIPLDDITHASITRDVVPPQRQPFSSPRRQSSIKTHDIVVMETMDSATPTNQASNTIESANKSESETESESKVTKTDENQWPLTTEVHVVVTETDDSVGASGGSMERSPALSMSDTDTESERGSETIATPTELSVSDLRGPLEEGGVAEGNRTGDELVREEMGKEGREEGGEGEREGGEEGRGEKERGEDEEEGRGEGEGGEEERGEAEGGEEGEKGEEEKEGEREGGEEGMVEGGKQGGDIQLIVSSESGTHLNKDGEEAGSNNPSNENDKFAGSAEDLLAIMGSGDPSEVARPHAPSLCRVMSLDALLGDAAYFLHFRVAGERYTYAPVNTEKGVDIPRGVSNPPTSPPVQCTRTLFCFVVPERNLEKVVSFLSLHHPQGSARLGSPSDQQKWTDGHFEIIHGSRLENEDLSFCDDHFKNPDSWEVYSLTDIHKFRNVIYRMEVEDTLPLPTMMTESMLVSESHIKKLVPHLPSQAIGHNMHLIYSTFTHGISLRTMYRNMLAFGDTPVLFIVRDDANKLFGAMVSSYLRLSNCFYGTGESCLFSFDDEDNLDVFPWTGLNSYFIKGNTDSIVIGSGDGHFGLWLDENFLHGSSYNCETYGNRSLATTEDFLCTGVEAWGFRGNV